MSKTIKNMYNKKLTIESLFSAHERARINKNNKAGVIRFMIDLETNICNIYNNLKKGTYKIGKYKTFTIYEPKERIIKSLPYIDRIVQQWYIYEFIKPYIVPRLITDTCACINGRGTHYAVDKVQKYMKIMKRKYNNYYILKCDIKKYFYSIDKKILFNTMCNYINDKKLINLTYKLIYDDNKNIGIPIGNYTSQYFANIYLNSLDHYVKETLKIKYYVRYMDDFILLLKDKNECKFILSKIKMFIENNLNLSLNSKSKYYPSSMGVNFCGYRIFETHKLLRNRCKKKIKHDILIWNKLHKEDKLNNNKMILKWNSWIAHAKHANSYTYRIKMYNNVYNKSIISFR